MIKIAITGGIGSGKSHVAKLLNIPVYNADDEAKRLMQTDEGIRADLLLLLGDKAYCADGTLNKPFLAAYLFASPPHAARINEIVHPRVRQDFNRWVAEQERAGEEMVGLELAILFEAQFEDTVDAVVMVYAPPALRMKRAMQRDRATEEQIRERMDRQMSDEEKCRRADYVIRNDDSEPLPSQLKKMIDELTIRFRKRG